MDNLQWFKFSPVDWVMGKIQKVPETTQLRFIRLMCLYWNKECFLTYDDAEVEIDKEHLDLLISKRVIKVNDGIISIQFLDEQFGEVSIKRREKKKYAAIGNLKRWHEDTYKLYESGQISLNDALRIVDEKKLSLPDSNTIATQSGNNRKTSQSREDKRRVDNINNNLSVNWDAFLKQFNEITGKRIRVIDEKAKRQIKARLKEGYTKDDIVKAIENCANDNYQKENGLKWLTPEFISRADKLSKYSTITPQKTA